MLKLFSAEISIPKKYKMSFCRKMIMPKIVIKKCWLQICQKMFKLIFCRNCLAEIRRKTGFVTNDLPIYTKTNFCRN